MKRICLAIGVSRAESLAPLPGAVTAARDVAAWARGSGFDAVEALTDQDPSSPVTIRALQKVLEKLLADDGEGIDTFVLHFAGHGLRAGAEQNLWLPTTWKTDLRAVSVETLRNRLYRHGIANLSIFSDACRSLPNDVEITELTPDAVLGRGPYDRSVPTIDRFSAVADGHQAFMVTGAGPDQARCVFSTAMIEGLWGHHDDAFDKHISDKVTPESLDLYLKKRVRELGKRYGFSCSPENSPGTPRDHLFYFERGRPIFGAFPPAPTWPDPPKSEAVRAPDRLSLELSIDIQGLDKGYIEKHYRSSPQRAPRRKSGRKIEERRWAIQDKFGLPEEAVLSSANLVVRGDNVRQIWGEGFNAVRLSGAIGSSAFRISLGEAGCASLLIELEDDSFASALIYPGLITVLTLEPKGVLGWVCVEPWGDLPAQMDRSLDAIAKLGVGELNASEADELAAELRRFKHANPILGALSSYLYDYSGDVESIRRMAFFYADRGQSIPFDIAFMGLLNIKRRLDGSRVAVPAVAARQAVPKHLPGWVSDATPAISGTVGGSWPIFRQGWFFMEDPEPSEAIVARDLSGLSEHLLPSAFTSFDSAGGQKAIEMFQLEECL